MKNINKKGIIDKVLEFQLILLSPLNHSKDKVMEAKKFLASPVASVHTSEKVRKLTRLTYPALMNHFLTIQVKNSNPGISSIEIEKLLPKMAEDVEKYNSAEGKRKKIIKLIFGINGNENNLTIT